MICLDKNVSSVELKMNKWQRKRIKAYYRNKTFQNMKIGMQLARDLQGRIPPDYADYLKELTWKCIRGKFLVKRKLYWLK